MPIHAVTYTYADRPAELDAIRPSHREFLAGLYADGVLLASGPLSADDADPAGALIVLRAESVQEVEGVLDADPFASAGLISARRVRPWSPVIGDWADRV